MKICIYHRRRYIALFIVFSMLFCAALSLLVFIGERNSQRFYKATELSADTDTPITVIIDPGHGGEDGGAVGVNGVLEKDLNLSIAKIICDTLRADGVNAVMTREDDTLLYDKNSDYHGKKKIQDLATRRKIAEKYENVLFISIHMNAFPEGKYSGLQVYYSKNDASSQTLAESIQNTVKEKLTPSNNRSPKAAGDNIYLLDRLSCPAILVECGFLSNPDECQRLSDGNYQKQLSLCISASVMEYISVGT